MNIKISCMLNLTSDVSLVWQTEHLSIYEDTNPILFLLFFSRPNRIISEFSVDIKTWCSPV
jgi:hypothetical protein